MQEDPALLQLLRQQAAVLTVSQAVALLGRHAVHWRLRTARWQRRHPRVLVAQSGPLTAEQERWAAVLHCGMGAVLARETAAALGGLRGYEDTRTHVVVPAHRHPEPARGIVVRRSARLSAADLAPGRLPPRTAIERSVLDAAAAAGEADRAAAILLAAVQQGLTRAERLQAVLDRLPNQRRRALLGDVLLDAAGGTHSLPERQFTRLIRRHGIPAPSLQVVRLDSDGRRRYVDAEWTGYSTRVEIDGSTHREVQRWWGDLDRQNDLQLADRFILLRFPAYVVRHRSAEVAGLLERALRAGGWRP